MSSPRTVLAEAPPVEVAQAASIAVLLEALLQKLRPNHGLCDNGFDVCCPDSFPETRKFPSEPNDTVQTHELGRLLVLVRVETAIGLQTHELCQAVPGADTDPVAFKRHITTPEWNSASSPSCAWALLSFTVLSKLLVHHIPDSQRVVPASSDDSFVVRTYSDALYPLAVALKAQHASADAPRSRSCPCFRTLASPFDVTASDVMSASWPSNVWSSGLTRDTREVRDQALAVAGKEGTTIGVHDD